MRHLLIYSLLLVSLNSVSGQFEYFALDNAGHFGYESGENAYAVFGADLGFSQYISLGVTIKYLVKSEIEFENNRFTTCYYGHVHLFDRLTSENTDLLMGVNFQSQILGMHGECRVYINEFLGFYGKITYHSELPPTVLNSNITLNSKIRGGVGLVVRTSTRGEQK